MLVWNILLALAWAALTGRFSLGNLSAGFALGYTILALMEVGGIASTRGYGARVFRVFQMAAFFFWELLLANVRVAYDVMTPRHRMRPGIVAIPLDAESDAEITMLANLITLTPGTLTLDVSDDRTVIYIHAMYMTDPATLRQAIKRGFESRVLELLR